MEKTILLTGASSGIGNSIAKILAQKDFFVYAIVRKVEDKKAFENFDNIKVFLADITKEEDITKLKQEIYSQNNKITGIINNAGVAFT